MKKLLTIALLGGLFAANTLQAQVDIYIAGSTAFRANVFRAVTAALDPGFTKVPSTASSGTSVVTFQGTINALYGGQTVTIYCSYNGSVQGLGNLALNQNVTFTNASPGGAAVTHVPNITFTDVDKISTLFPNADTIETHVAVLPFVYCRNTSCPTTVTNVTGHQLRPAWDNGVLKLSYFTGNTNDDSGSMYLTGRNKDSGTRVTASADGYYTDTPVIYGFNTPPTGFGIMNVNLSGALYGFGYASGGNEAQAITNTGAAGPMIGYLGLNDALLVAGGASAGALQSHGGGNCAIIAYDGNYPFTGYTAGSSPVPASPDYTPITTGKYSLWSYECIETQSANSGNNIYKWYTNMVSNLDADIALAKANGGNSAIYGPVTAIRLSEMRCSRASVGGKITPN